MYKTFHNLDIVLPVERLKKPFVLDELIQKAGELAIAEKVSGYDLHHIVMLLSLLIEEHKEVARWSREVEEVRGMKSVLIAC